MKSTLQKFDVKKVPLAGTNLIEASAGTGKTYSIAILVLRLILENEILLPQILMVTYTKAAVAELETRIRLFVNTAHAAAKGKKIKDETIKEIVDNAATRQGNKKTEELLKNAVLFLDETSVLTIHSFCQQVLNEFAFETNQLFGSALTTDRRSIITEEVQKFWRKNITSLPVPVLRNLRGLNIANITNVVNSHLNGKKFYAFEKDKTYKLTEEEADEWMGNTENERQTLEELRIEILKYISDNTDNLDEKISTNSNAVKTFGGTTADPEIFLNKLFEKVTVGYVAKLFPDLQAQALQFVTAKEKIEDHTNIFLNHVYNAAISDVSTGVKQYMESHNQMSFDDLIQKLHIALVAHENPKLVYLLQSKYKAVFIDEFQDTDLMQYEIFEKAFGTNTILFYIGDPKQSIYAFRAADIFTYLNARDKVENQFEMNVNYRSGENYIKGMNKFFFPEKEFDTFHFGLEKNGISYINVDAPADRSPGTLLENETVVPGINIIEAEGKDSVRTAVAIAVANLLGAHFMIEREGQKRRVRPSDIGILVQSGRDARDIRDALAAKQIPAVTLSDEKIFDSPEAKDILYLLRAIYEINVSNINRALLNNFTGLSENDILRIDSEKMTALFSRYKDLWVNESVFIAFNAFLQDFNVRSVLLDENTVAGERCYTNLQQLIEIVYKKERQNKLSPADLIASLERLINEGEEGDEYLQRIEREEEAVRIVTVHKSKGLEYNIVLLPTLDYKPRIKDTLITYRDPQLGEYVTSERKKTEQKYIDLYNEQSEQEYRRLLYVAVTRAVYCSFIFSNISKKIGNTTLKKFTSKISQNENIYFRPLAELNADLNYTPDSNGEKFQPKPLSLAVKGNNWIRTSYSSMAAHLPVLPKERKAFFNEEYDEFIFRSLKPGSKSGNIIHDIFEHINFRSETYWQDAVTSALQKFEPSAKEAQAEHFIALIKNVLNAEMKNSEGHFILADVETGKRLHELEFNFIVNVFDPLLIPHTFNNDELLISVKETGDIEGLLNGMIDMFFEHDGKYYILDWKSTYLGSSLQNYDQQSLSDAMNENNYHLQYLIYCVAAKKYLQSRLPAFDYEKDFGGVYYAFVRGMRAGGSSGIFFNRPSAESILKLEAIFNND